MAFGGIAAIAAATARAARARMPGARGSIELLRRRQRHGAGATHLLEAAPLGQRLDAMAAVLEDAPKAVDVADLRFGGGTPRERHVGLFLDCHARALLRAASNPGRGRHTDVFESSARASRRGNVAARAELGWDAALYRRPGAQPCESLLARLESERRRRVPTPEPSEAADPSRLDQPQAVPAMSRCAHPSLADEGRQEGRTRARARAHVAALMFLQVGDRTLHLSCGSRAAAGATAALAVSSSPACWSSSRSLLLDANMPEASGLAR